MLNVFTPVNASSSSKLPVRVWLYGGSNLAGGISDPLYNGCYSSTDSVLVTINYRLGPLGYLALEDIGLNGNYGISDQLLGLQWVQDNIAAFGGDPSRVMLFGQSSGADDTFAISTTDHAGTLFHAVVLESSDASYVNLSVASASNAPFLAALNCTKPPRKCLREISLDALNSTFNLLRNNLTIDVIIDGIVIPSQPTDSGPKVPAIIGTTSNEASLLILGQYGEAVSRFNESDYFNFLSSNYGDNATLINQTYPISDFSSEINPVLSAMSYVQTLSTFRCPTRRFLAASAANGVPVWTYEFNHTPSCSWTKEVPNRPVVLELLGPAHTSEIPFVFGVVENLPPPDGTCNLTSAESDISMYMKSAWNNMARFAQPPSDWPMYSLNSSMGIIFQNGSQAGHIDYSMCDFWDMLAGVNLNQIKAVQNTTSSQSVGGSNATQGETSEAIRMGSGRSFATCAMFVIAFLGLFWASCYAIQW